MIKIDRLFNPNPYLIKMFKQDGTGSNTIAHDDVIIQPVGKGRMDIPCTFWLDWLDFHRRRNVPLFLLHSHPLTCSPAMQLNQLQKVRWSVGESVGPLVRSLIDLPFIYIDLPGIG